MQNCNVSPFAMMKDSPMVPKTYKDHPYLYNAPASPGHQRAEMMNDLLAAADHVTVEQAIDIAFNPQVWHAEHWQKRLETAWKAADGSSRKNGAEEVYTLIRDWNRRSDADSPGALAFFAFKKALGREQAHEVEPPASLSDQALVEALGQAATWLKDTFSAVRTPYGAYFRVGREGGNRSWPVGGGSLREVGMATPRAISFDPAPDRKTTIGRGGQTSTQIVVLTNPPQSWAVIPLGESDHRDSGHWDDQAERLFSQSQAAPTYFLKKDELMKHVTTKKVLSVEAKTAAAAN
jgi:acyl-homoserine-lactone acylase